MKTDPIRLRALDLLVQVDQGGRLDPLLDEALAALPEARDRAFLAELVRGTLQWRERYRHVLTCFLRRQAPDNPVLLQVFFLALHQLVALDRVPPYAAVHQAGQLCRQRVSTGQVGFVNGILQAVCRRLLPDWNESQGPDAATREQRLRPLFETLETDTARLLAAWHSHPLWLVQGWLAEYGEAATREICAADNRPVDVFFHVLEPAAPGEVLARVNQAGAEVLRQGPERTLKLARRLDQAELRRLLEQFPSLVVQDAAVQEATAWLQSAADRAPAMGRDGLPVVDMCAAPGGKTARLAAAWNRRHPVLAWDNRPRRIELLRDTLARTELLATVQVALADGLEPPLSDGSCAAVLLDGPCSGTGVLRHHPEGRWQLSRKAPRRNGELLLELAEKAADLLAPGGLLMYATCSLEPQENQAVVEGLLARRTDLEPLPDDEGRWQRQWLPGQGPGDGFFAARLLKTS